MIIEIGLNKFDIDLDNAQEQTFVLEDVPVMDSIFEHTKVVIYVSVKHEVGNYYTAYITKERVDTYTDEAFAERQFYYGAEECPSKETVISNLYVYIIDKSRGCYIPK